MAAVIDFGLVGLGDPACDLMAAWTCLDLPAGRRIFRQVLAADDATWSRARGWALLLGLRAAAWSVGNPVLTAIGHSTITAVLADAQG
jgi:aminoglycoside phosphotransferase (APT) family kinase protein